MFKAVLNPDSIFRTILTIVFFGLMLWYAVFQARHLIDGPKIVFTDELNTVNTEKTVFIRGTTENITHLSMNGREIYTDQDGIFEESLVLENGYTIMTLTAKDRYGRSTSISRSFVYQEDTIN